jgi:hypothetical protein
MQLVGPQGLFVFMALVCGLTAFVTTLRRRSRVPVEDQEPLGGLLQRAHLQSRAAQLVEVGEHRGVVAVGVVVQGPLGDAASWAWGAPAIVAVARRRCARICLRARCCARLTFESTCRHHPVDVLPAGSARQES